MREGTDPIKEPQIRPRGDIRASTSEKDAYQRAAEEQRQKVFELKRRLQDYESDDSETIRVREISKVVYQEMYKETKKKDLLIDVALGGASDRIKDPTERQNPEYLKLEEQFHTRCLDRIDNSHQSSVQLRRGRSDSVLLRSREEQLKKQQQQLDLLESGIGFQAAKMLQNTPMGQLESYLPTDKTGLFPEDGSQELGQGDPKRRKVMKEVASQELQLDQIKKTFGQALWAIDSQARRRYKSNPDRWNSFKNAMAPLLQHFRPDMSRQELSNKDFQAALKLLKDIADELNIKSKGTSAVVMDTLSAIRTYERNMQQALNPFSQPTDYGHQDVGAHEKTTQEQPADTQKQPADIQIKFLEMECYLSLRKMSTRGLSDEWKKSFHEAIDALVEKESPQSIEDTFGKLKGIAAELAQAGKLKTAQYILNTIQKYEDDKQALDQGAQSRTEMSSGQQGEEISPSPNPLSQRDVRPRGKITQELQAIRDKIGRTLVDSLLTAKKYIGTLAKEDQERLTGLIQDLVDHYEESSLSRKDFENTISDLEGAAGAIDTKTNSTSRAALEIINAIVKYEHDMRQANMQQA